MWGIGKQEMFQWNEEDAILRKGICVENVFLPAGDSKIYKALLGKKACEKWSLCGANRERPHPTYKEQSQWQS